MQRRQKECRAEDTYLVPGRRGPLPIFLHSAVSLTGAGGSIGLHNVSKRLLPKNGEQACGMPGCNTQRAGHLEYRGILRHAWGARARGGRHRATAGLQTARVYAGRPMQAGPTLSLSLSRALSRPQACTGYIGRLHVRLASSIGRIAFNAYCSCRCLLLRCRCRCLESIL